MRTRSTYQPQESRTARGRMKMAAAGALVAAGPMLGWIILTAYVPLGGAQ
jgi:hypothetical protein